MIPHRLDRNHSLRLTSLPRLVHEDVREVAGEGTGAHEARPVARRDEHFVRRQLCDGRGREAVATRAAVREDVCGDGTLWARRGVVAEELGGGERGETLREVVG